MNKTILRFFGAICIIILVYALAGFLLRIEDKMEIEYATKNVEHFYVDGQEVDRDKIDLTMYNYTVEGDECYLSPKGSHHGAVPAVYPVF